VLEVAKAQLAYAELAPLFEAVFSDEVRALKPALRHTGWSPNAVR